MATEMTGSVEEVQQRVSVKTDSELNAILWQAARRDGYDDFTLHCVRAELQQRADDRYLRVKGMC